MGLVRTVSHNIFVCSVQRPQWGPGQLHMYMYVCMSRYNECGPDYPQPASLCFSGFRIYRALLVRTTPQSIYYGWRQTDMISSDPHSIPKQVRLTAPSASRRQYG